METGKQIRWHGTDTWQSRSLRSFNIQIATTYATASQRHSWNSIGEAKLSYFGLSFTSPPRYNTRPYSGVWNVNWFFGFVSSGSGIIGVAKHPNCLSLLLIIIVCIRVLFSFQIDHNSLYAGFFFCLFGYIFYFNSRIIA